MQTCPMCGTPLDGSLSETLEEYKAQGNTQQQAEFADAMEWYFKDGENLPDDYKEYLEWKQAKAPPPS